MVRPTRVAFGAKPRCSKARFKLDSNTKPLLSIPTPTPTTFASAEAPHQWEIDTLRLAFVTKPYESHAHGVFPIRPQLTSSSSRQQLPPLTFQTVDTLTCVTTTECSTQTPDSYVPHLTESVHTEQQTLLSSSPTTVSFPPPSIQPSLLPPAPVDFFPFENDKHHENVTVREVHTEEDVPVCNLLFIQDLPDQVDRTSRLDTVRSLVGPTASIDLLMDRNTDQYNGACFVFMEGSPTDLMSYIHPEHTKLDIQLEPDMSHYWCISNGVHPTMRLEDTWDLLSSTAFLN